MRISEMGANMDIKTYVQILHDKSFFDFDKMKHKYKNDFKEFLSLLKDIEYKELAIKDFKGKNAVYLKNYVALNVETVKLMSYIQSNDSYSFKAAEDEIAASNAIESINFSRESIRNILKGLAPKDDIEDRILGQKKGIEFIADKSNIITEENLHKLYMMMVGKFLKDEEDKLLEGNLYRHDSVFVVGNKVEHTGLDHRKLNEYMKLFIEFINEKDDISDFDKGSIIHFYMVHIHPYFDGNGRMARMLHLWFLIQKGYAATLFVPFSSLIEKNRNAYYKAISQVEDNQNISGDLDITPFIKYFSEYVYSQIPKNIAQANTFDKYDKALKDGIVTEKETQLWSFVLSHYGTAEFSTKQLEKDFGNAAYATIRSFVLKFEEFELLNSKKYGNRVKYSVKK
ncbi:MAG: Fic family protein [Ruminococcaceae bacterium]|nr:Fic family protein [Oscillospiraceae bacterium]